MPGGTKDKKKKQKKDDAPKVPGFWERRKRAKKADKYFESQQRGGFWANLPSEPVTAPDRDRYATDEGWEKANRAFEKDWEKSQTKRSKLLYAMKTKVRDTVGGILSAFSSKPDHHTGVNPRLLPAPLLEIVFGGAEGQLMSTRTAQALVGLPTADGLRQAIEEVNHEFDDELDGTAADQLLLNLELEDSSPEQRFRRLMALGKTLETELGELIEHRSQLTQSLKQGRSSGRSSGRKREERLVAELGRRISVYRWLIADVEGAIAAARLYADDPNGFLQALKPGARRSYGFIAEAISAGATVGI